MIDSKYFGDFNASPEMATVLLEQKIPDLKKAPMLDKSSGLITQTISPKFRGSILFI